MAMSQDSLWGLRCVCVCVYYTVLDMVMKAVRHCGCLAPYANRERDNERQQSGSKGCEILLRLERDHGKLFYASAK